MVRDAKAERLESKGLYRRAAARWQEVIPLTESDTGRVWLIRRINECLAKVGKKPADSGSFIEVTRAVREAQKRMGVDQPEGQAFRLKTKK
ncbi:MAG: PerC family transcriptional regulator [Pantoea sp.]|uniref:PerC family transcriptional regulator n=1 Tax=Pantoea piersonii TaxID=2364647 RepID=UPI0028AF703D|nr:PerC family transcriptional regulator [Pantoea piersonii]MDU6441028.1 PerC family transcriptional regulator [Pantoea sp.]